MGGISQLLPTLQVLIVNLLVLYYWASISHPSNKPSPPFFCIITSRPLLYSSSRPDIFILAADPHFPILPSELSPHGTFEALIEKLIPLISLFLIISLPPSLC